ncbi:MAG: diacylglycerol kinase family lipid kinase [Abditibacteriales bacterium]|nr:diacylglycerol kinase family lipid kinase [Abditibacteriales bacterium]MDW8364615.1 diacylglycerol kinase family lipid kinase [Abditibacteriales bacterium]
MRSILLIANPIAAAGQARRRWDALLAGLRARGLHAEYVFTERPLHAITLAAEASRSYDVLVAVGGDGTANEVATGILLSGAQTALGIVPFGTGNDVAPLVGIHSVEDALRALTQGRARMMDVIEVNCQHGGSPAKRYALLYASVGFAGEVLKRTTPFIKRVFGPRYCYTVGFFRALLHYRAPMMEVACDGQTFAGRYFFVGAGNAEVVGGGTMRLSPGARIDDGLMNVSVIEALGRLETARHFPKLLTGTYTAHPKVRYFPATALSVASHPPKEVQMDGDLFGLTPATFRVQPKALRVLGVKA